MEEEIKFPMEIERQFRVLIDPKHSHEKTEITVSLPIPESEKSHHIMTAVPWLRLNQARFNLLEFLVQDCKVRAYRAVYDVIPDEFITYRTP